MNVSRLEELNMAKAEKVDNIACWVKNLEADVAAFEAQEKALLTAKAQPSSTRSTNLSTI
ncbi:MAG: siphovirus Gp157 family protein [Faecalibacterium sp.]